MQNQSTVSRGALCRLPNLSQAVSCQVKRLSSQHSERMALSVPAGTFLKTAGAVRDPAFRDPGSNHSAPGGAAIRNPDLEIDEMFLQEHFVVKERRTLTPFLSSMQPLSWRGISPWEGKASVAVPAGTFSISSSLRSYSRPRRESTPRRDSRAAGNHDLDTIE